MICVGRSTHQGIDSSHAHYNMTLIIILLSKIASRVTIKQDSIKFVVYKTILNPSLSVHQVYKSNEYIPDYNAKRLQGYVACLTVSKLRKADGVEHHLT